MILFYFTERRFETRFLNFVSITANNYISPYFNAYLVLEDSKFYLQIILLVHYAMRANYQSLQD